MAAQDFVPLPNQSWYLKALLELSNVLMAYLNAVSLSNLYVKENSYISRTGQKT